MVLVTCFFFFGFAPRGGKPFVLKFTLLQPPEQQTSISTVAAVGALGP